jgi:hypothetical protein
MTEIRIETRIDRERGCGWRQAGGKYLVGGQLCRPCGKLPFQLDRCPCCDHGIKPSRGWTWTGARLLLNTVFCHSPTCDGGTCVLWNPPEKAGLLWIGGQFYTPESFTREAAALGISRRIAQVPKDFQVGETLVLLAHREIEFAWGQEPKPGIFAAFVPAAIEYVVRGDEAPAELERLMRQGCTPVKVERGDEDERNAGALPVGDMAESADLRAADQERPADGAGEGEAGAEFVPEVSATSGSGIGLGGGPPGPEARPATEAV